MSQSWALLIYTVPAEPSRMRAAIWRDLKRAGAVYLRSGVSAIPERLESVSDFEAIAAKAISYGGRATLVRHAELDDATASELTAALHADREAEYHDLLREAEGLLAHLRQEDAHRDLSAADRAAFASDLEKLQRWARQIRARDFFGHSEPDRLAAVLQMCADALGRMPATE
jgi:DNA-binding transcriptional regulator PaaX